MVTYFSRKQLSAEKSAEVVLSRCFFHLSFLVAGSREELVMLARKMWDKLVRELDLREEREGEALEQYLWLHCIDVVLEYLNAKRKRTASENRPLETERCLESLWLLRHGSAELAEGFWQNLPMLSKKLSKRQQQVLNTFYRGEDLETISRRTGKDFKYLLTYFMDGHRVLVDGLLALIGKPMSAKTLNLRRKRECLLAIDELIYKYISDSLSEGEYHSLWMMVEGDRSLRREFSILLLLVQALSIRLGRWPVTWAELSGKESGRVSAHACDHNGHHSKKQKRGPRSPKRVTPPQPLPLFEQAQTRSRTVSERMILGGMTGLVFLFVVSLGVASLIGYRRTQRQDPATAVSPLQSSRLGKISQDSGTNSVVHRSLSLAAKGDQKGGARKGSACDLKHWKVTQIRRGTVYVVKRDEEKAQLLAVGSRVKPGDSLFLQNTAELTIFQGERSLCLKGDGKVVLRWWQKKMLFILSTGIFEVKCVPAQPLKIYVRTPHAYVTRADIPYHVIVNNELSRFFSSEGGKTSGKLIVQLLKTRKYYTNKPHLVMIVHRHGDVEYVPLRRK